MTEPQIPEEATKDFDNFGANEVSAFAADALAVAKSEQTRRIKRSRLVTDAYKKVDRVIPAADAPEPAGDILPEEGQRLGRFLLTRELGRGFSSRVFEAHHRMLDINVALKVLLNRDLGEATRKLVYREAHLLATLNHPNIIRLLDFDEFGGYHVLILEYIDGLSLRDLVTEQTRIEPTMVLDVIRQAVAALRYAHGKGVVHNDIKPANILLTKEGGVKVADLGMAKVDRRQGSKESSGGHHGIAGTPAYISPEMVLKGFEAADHRSDIYSLGVSMYQCLCGQLPFEHDDPYQLLLKHAREEPVPLATIDPSIDLGLSTLVNCMMAKDPNERPQTYESLLDDLKVIQEGLESNDDDSSTFELIFDTNKLTRADKRATQSTRLFGWLFDKDAKNK